MSRLSGARTLRCARGAVGEIDGAGGDHGCICYRVVGDHPVPCALDPDAQTATNEVVRRVSPSGCTMSFVTDPR